jgi:hypothetical protein
MARRTMHRHPIVGTKSRPEEAVGRIPETMIGSVTITTATVTEVTTGEVTQGIMISLLRTTEIGMKGSRIIGRITAVVATGMVIVETIITAATIIGQIVANLICAMCNLRCISWPLNLVMSFPRFSTDETQTALYM